MEEFHDLPARFGASFPANGMRVLAVKAYPENGCTNITRPPVPTKSEDSNARWAVLIARWVHQVQAWNVHLIDTFTWFTTFHIFRYDCSFEVKVRNAQAAGYAAAIVYNLNSNDLGKKNNISAIATRITYSLFCSFYSIFSFQNKCPQMIRTTST